MDSILKKYYWTGFTRFIGYLLFILTFLKKVSMNSGSELKRSRADRNREYLRFNFGQVSHSIEMASFFSSFLNSGSPVKREEL